ncbi:MAG: DUF5103 domain-containing protein [Bacteroidia bacterium]
MKRHQRPSILAILITIISIGLRFAGAQDYGGFIPDDRTYLPQIKTVQFLQVDKPFSMPLMQLGDPNGSLVLHFDDLDGGFVRYSYTLIHCTADWTPSGMLSTQYLDGFQEDQVVDYRTSFNTLKPYTHYKISIPSENIRPTLSGNYVLHVYRDGDRNAPVLTRRFFVLQPLMSVIPIIRRPSRPDVMAIAHEIDFDVNTGDQQVYNPFDELKVVIRQNGRWDNQVGGLPPQFIRNNVISYDHNDRNIFTAGNEFRRIDLRNIRFRGQGVSKIEIGQESVQVWAEPEEGRAHLRYFSYQDLNGNYLIQSNEARNSEHEADYLNVTFSLLQPTALRNARVHLFGQLTDWKLDSTTELTYLPALGAYQITVPLKQGYYDYCYAWVRNGGQLADDTWFEGSHQETECDYEIFVYHQPPVSPRYDRLVAYTRFNSMNRTGR